MKKYLKLSLLSFIALITLYSCDKTSTEIETQANNSPFASTKLSDPTLKIKIQDYLKKNKINFENNSLLKKEDIEFDLEDLYLVTYEGTTKTGIVANQKKYDSSNAVNFGVSFYQDSENSEIFKTLIVKTERINTSMNEIEYYDSDGTLLLSFQINSLNQSVKTNYLINTQETNKGKLCSGSETAACLQDVYANHGWVSVWAFVQSAFIPQTAAALAILCAYSC
jgi:hypothetical protein